MYVKFFKNRTGGSTASIKYLLNEREEEGTAKVLKGDRRLTGDIIKSISNKQKVTVGVLSFEERNLKTSQKEELMEEFEKVLFPGLSPDEYNILWVEHTDKGRLELNFVIPKMHLPSQKALNPYYHAVDFPRIEMFEDIYNIKYKLTSKKDPRRAQTVQGSKKEVNLFNDYKKLDEQLHEMVASGSIRNRVQLVELLTQSSIEVTRTGRDYISIKLPDSKRAKKFKGSIYDEQFKSLGSIEELSAATDRRIIKFLGKDTSRELEQTIKRLDQYNERKAQQLRSKYQYNPEDLERSEREAERETAREQSAVQLGGDNISFTFGDNPTISPRDVYEQQQSSAMDSAKGYESGREWSLLPTDSTSNIQQRQKDNIHQDIGVADDTRRRTLKRIREREEQEQRAYEDARTTRRAVLESIKRESRRIQAEFERNLIEQSTDFEEECRSCAAESQIIVEESRHHLRNTEHIVESARRREGAISGSLEPIKRTRELIEKLEEFRDSIKRSFSTAIQQSTDFTRVIREKLVKEQPKPKPKPKPKPSYSYGMRM